MIDWGKDQRLKDFQKSLDSLLEESRRRASEASKSQAPPSASSGTSTSKRAKSSSSRRASSKSGSVLTPSEPHLSVFEPEDDQGLLDPCEDGSFSFTAGPQLAYERPDDCRY